MNFASTRYDPSSGQPTTDPDTAKQVVLGFYALHKYFVHAAIVPNSGRIVTAHADGTVRLWDSGGQLIPILDKLQSGNINALDISPDGSLALVASEAGEAAQYLINDQDLLQIAACRVGRGFTSDEIQRFNVGTPQFDFSKRQCPPSAYQPRHVDDTGRYRAPPKKPTNPNFRALPVI